MIDIQTLIILAVVIAGFAFLILNQNRDTTSTEDIVEATKLLEQEISRAEEIVGRCAPHCAECRQLLGNARYCLQFSGSNSRLVVSRAMVKQKRLEGVKYAQKAIEMAGMGAKHQH